jgi:hypothetical protein
MKIRSVKANNRRKAFEVATAKRRLLFPYSRLEVQPTSDDPIAKVFVDRELGAEGFTYVLQSGREGTVHIEAVLEYNQDPDYLRDLLLYRLTLEAQKAVATTSLARRRSSAGSGPPRPSSTGSSTRRTTGSPWTSSSGCSRFSITTSSWWCGRRARSEWQLNPRGV